VPPLPVPPLPVAEVPPAPPVEVPFPPVEPPAPPIVPDPLEQAESAMQPKTEDKKSERRVVSIFGNLSRERTKEMYPAHTMAPSLRCTFFYRRESAGRPR
jgi:hypothetical protein